MLKKPCISKIILYIISQFTVFLIVAPFNLRGKHGEGYLIDISIGVPEQTFQVIVDTGSSNFAIAATKNAFTNFYFNPQNSSTFQMLHKNVSSKYTQGKWNGVLGIDLITIPFISYNRAVRTDISLIQDTELFFKNNSEWQGLLGLAYSEISRPDQTVLSWIDAVHAANNNTALAFSLELCGMTSNNNSNHFGNFDVILGRVDTKPKFVANILREWFYEIAIVDIAVNNESLSIITCQDINNDKSIVDSGSTNLILPERVYKRLSDALCDYVTQHNITLTPNFWNTKDTSCFDSPQDWSSLPNISIAIARDAASYFILDLPGPSYVKQIFGNENSTLKYCYKVAIEKSAGNVGSILGAISMEGFKIIFNRTARTIEYQPSDCGPNVGLRGIFYDRSDILQNCTFSTKSSRSRHMPSEDGSFFNRNILPIFFISVLIIIAALVFVYLLKKGKETSWASHVFISMNRTPQLINED